MNAPDVLRALEAHATNRTGDVNDAEFIALCKRADELGVMSVSERLETINMQIRHLCRTGQETISWFQIGVLSGALTGSIPEGWLREPGKMGPLPPKVGGILE